MINEEIQILINQLINEKITMVDNARFQTVVRHYNHLSNIDGDIIECGCWRGGFSIFLSHLFSNRNIWVCDSFCGFQPLGKAKYIYQGNERHTDTFGDTADGPIGVSLDVVKSNFQKYGIKNDRINFIEGFVNDTLPKLPIKKIALLRIDVDAYSATLECLYNLYDKVSSGGYIIFDDSCLHETVDAIKDFIQENQLPNILYDSESDEILDLNLFGSKAKTYPKCGCYIIKQ